MNPEHKSIVLFQVVTSSAERIVRYGETSDPPDLRWVEIQVVKIRGASGWPPNEVAFLRLSVPELFKIAKLAGMRPEGYGFSVAPKNPAT